MGINKMFTHLHECKNNNNWTEHYKHVLLYTIFTCISWLISIIHNVMTNVFMKKININKGKKYVEV